MNKKTTWRRVLSILCVFVMLMGVTIVGTLTASAAETEVAFVGETGYTTLAAAVDAAPAGATITLADDVTENVTLSKKVTIDGQGNTYTGTMTLSKVNVATVIENVNFVGGCITMEKYSRRTLTVKNCTFDGADTSLNYAITAKGGDKLVVENCTAKNYNYGMIYVTSSVTNITIKNVSAENMNYGFRLSYGSKATLENVTFNTKYGVETQSFGAKSLTLTDCNFTSEYPINVVAQKALKDTFTFNGTNTFTTDATWETLASDYANFVNPENVTFVAPAEPVAEVNGVQYTTLQAALDAAVDGDVVKVIADHTLNMMDVDHFALVSGDKSITLDLNGKNIVCDPHDINKQSDYFTVFHVMDGATLTVKDSVGTGKVTADGAGTWLAYMFKNDATTTVESGNFELSAINGGAMFYSSNNNMTVKGGTFYQLTSGWMFNAKGNSDNAEGLPQNVITVSGGTFNRNFLAGPPSENDDHEVVLAEGYKLVQKSENLWTVVTGTVAKIGDVEYSDLQAAIDKAQNGDTIEIVANIYLDGSTVKAYGHYAKDGYDFFFNVQNKNITIDFNDYYITVAPTSHGNVTNPIITALYNKQMVDADGVVSVMLIDDGSNVTFTGNGGIKTVYEEGKTLAMYSLLYVHGSVLTVESGDYYGAKVLDCLFYGDDGLNMPQHMFIKGGNFFVENANRDKPWVVNVNGKNDETFTVISGGTYNYDIMFNYGTQKDCEIIIADGYKLTQKSENVWVVEFDGFVKIGEQSFDTLAAALKAVKNGETIDIMADLAENVTITQTKGLSFTINGNGHKYTGTITINGGANRAETLTITGLNFVLAGEWQKGIATTKSSFAHNVTIENCSFTGVDAGVNKTYAIHLRSVYNFTIKNVTGNNLFDLVYAQNSVTGLTVENVTVENSNHGFFLAYGEKLSFTNVETINCAVAFGYKNQTSGATISFTDCKFDHPMFIETHTRYNVTLKLNNCELPENWLDVTKATASASVRVEWDENTAVSANGVICSENYKVYGGANVCVVTETPVISGRYLNINSNTINFVFELNSLFKGCDFTATINGVEVAVENLKAAVALNAKQMADDLTIELFYNGNMVDTKTCSVKQYVIDGLKAGSFSDDLKVLLAAMLNYGAEAQKAFKYNTDNLANMNGDAPIFTDVVIENVVPEDKSNDLQNDYYHGASLNLKSDLEFNFKFHKDMLANADKAVVTYKDSKGNLQIIQINKNDFIVDINTRGEEFLVVKVTNITNLTALLTCDIQDADGKVITTAQDSVLSYCARAIAGLKAMSDSTYKKQQFQIEFYQALANYIVAKSNYKY